MWTQLRTLPAVAFQPKRNQNILHKWLPQLISMCYRTVNKYEFIKPQYLCIFPFCEKKMFPNNILYLFDIVQIYLCIRDSKIQNIYSVLFDILEAVDWRETYQNRMLKTSDFLNKILLTREMHKIFTKGGTQP